MSRVVFAAIGALAGGVAGWLFSKPKFDTIVKADSAHIRSSASNKPVPGAEPLHVPRKGAKDSNADKVKAVEKVQAKGPENPEPVTPPKKKSATELMKETHGKNPEKA